MTFLQAFMVVSLPITGMCYAILGALKIPLTERLKMDEAKVGGLISSFGIMVGPIILLAGFLTDTMGRKGVWIAGALMVAASLLLLSRTRQYKFAVVAVLLLSAGWAAMINVANALMYMAYDNVFMATNLLDFFFGLGAFLTPAAVVWLLRKKGFTTGVSILGGIAVIPVIMSLGVEMEAAGGAGESPGFASLFKDPVMIFCAITMLFWAPLESCTAAWSTTFVTNQAPDGEDELETKRIAAWTLSGFWLCFMGSRLITAGVYHFFEIAEVESARRVHIILAALSIAIMVGLVRSSRRGVTVKLILAAGLVFGPFFPNLMAILLSHFDASLHGRAIGLFFAGASIGWTLIPAIIGAYAKRTNLHSAFKIAVIDAALLLALVIGHFMYANR
jgi:MFS family permease